MNGLSVFVVATTTATGVLLIAMGSVGMGIAMCAGAAVAWRSLRKRNK